MELQYLKYNLEQLLEDKNFLSWIFYGENNKEWKKFLKVHPEFLTIVNDAKKIISAVREDNEVLDDSSVLEIWDRISEYQSVYIKKTRKMIIRRILSIAASVVFVIIFGTGVYAYLTLKGRECKFEINYPYESNNGYVLLSGGTEIPLITDNSTITINRENRSVIINDTLTIIDQAGIRSGHFHLKEIMVPYGKKSEIILDDGTHIWLNSGSKLAFHTSYSSKNRRLRIEGEGCFKVAHNDMYPFTVSAGELEVKVLGTHFNLSAFPEEGSVETVLLEGKININSPKQSGLGRITESVKPGQKAIFNKQKNEMVISEEPDPDLHIAWINGWLEYHRESLRSVLLKIERYYNIEIELPAYYPADDKISGKLDLKGSLKQVMDILAEASGIEYQIMYDKIYVE